MRNPVMEAVHIRQFTERRRLTAHVECRVSPGRDDVPHPEEHAERGNAPEQVHIHGEYEVATNPADAIEMLPSKHCGGRRTEVGRTATDDLTHERARCLQAVQSAKAELSLDDHAIFVDHFELRRGDRDPRVAHYLQLRRQRARHQNVVGADHFHKLPGRQGNRFVPVVADVEDSLITEEPHAGIVEGLRDILRVVRAAVVEHDQFEINILAED